ncbi:MAG: hypothetical protein VX412_01455 [Pseudomonadota bacterium]|nr:hypothetical protein [Pseudomonadota bacterium]
MESTKNAEPVSEAPASRNLQRILQASAVLWVVWGVAHIAFGAFGMIGFIGGDAAESMKAMLGGADPQTLEIDYPEPLLAVLNQHSWNLLWFGVFATVGGIMIWRRHAIAVLMTAVVGGAADAGYFMFVDLGGFAAPPGPQMTWISAAAIVLSLFVYFRTNRLDAL